MEHTRVIEDQPGNQPSMQPAVYRDELVTVYHADCLELLRTLPAESVAAVITDPPYGMQFMGLDWDKPQALGDRRNSTSAGTAYQLWCEQWVWQCWRVLKPGGHLVAFGGTRTWHRLMAGIEDAGFELRDTIAWLYGQGFPKSLDVSKAIDRAAGAKRNVISRERPVKRMATDAEQNRTGSWYCEGDRFYVPTVTAPATAEASDWSGWGTGLKPGFEPIILARKPLAGTVAANVRAHGVGALHIDACRVPTRARPAVVWRSRAHDGRSVYGHNLGGARHAGTTDLGRWPPNVVLTHAWGCADDCAPGCPVAELGQQSGTLRSGANPIRRHADVFRDCYGTFGGQRVCQSRRGMDTGCASRFFPAFRWHAKASYRERPRIGELAHPTVKPFGLIRWLVRLVVPPAGVVLDPFLGSGTTAQAARAEGVSCIGIEREAAYLPLIRARLQSDADGPVAASGALRAR